MKNWENKRNIANTKMSYKWYSQHSEKADRLKRKDFIRLVSEFNKMIAEYVIAGHQVQLPANAGVMCIHGHKPKIVIENGRIRGLAPDWKRTHEYNRKHQGEKKKIIYHTNDHSEGYRYHWVWSKKRMWLQYKWLYAFLPSRTNKRTLAESIREGNVDYCERA